MELVQIFNTEIFVPWYARQLFIASLIGIVIGIERETKGKPASLRTFSVISLGSCLYTILSVEGANMDQARVAAQIVSGVGFIGGGVIFKSSDKVEGITTAALIWLAAAAGMACGFNRNDIVLWTALVSCISIVLIMIAYWAISLYRKTRIWKKRNKRYVKSIANKSS